MFKYAVVRLSLYKKAELASTVRRPVWFMKGVSLAKDEASE